jgi:hypothetical protein
MTLSNSKVTGNTASCTGVDCWADAVGGIASGDGGTLALTNSAVSGNGASCVWGCVGGILETTGTATLTNSSVKQNSASCSGDSCVAVGGVEGDVGKVTLVRTNVKNNTPINCGFDVAGCALP